MAWIGLTDQMIIAELRRRCRAERLIQNVTQQDLADRAGLGINTVRRFEGDSDYSPSLDTFVSILRVLGGLGALREVLVPQPINPLDVGAHERQRARPGSAKAAVGKWKWGDEK